MCMVKGLMVSYVILFGSKATTTTIMCDELSACVVQCACSDCCARAKKAGYERKTNVKCEER